MLIIMLCLIMLIMSISRIIMSLLSRAVLIRLRNIITIMMTLTLIICLIRITISIITISIISIIITISRDVLCAVEDGSASVSAREAEPRMQRAAGLADALQPRVQRAEVNLHQVPRRAGELVRGEDAHHASLIARADRGLACLSTQKHLHVHIVMLLLFAPKTFETNDDHDDDDNNRKYMIMMMMTMMVMKTIINTVSTSQ